jgi:hypothetical protein
VAVAAVVLVPDHLLVLAAAQGVLELAQAKQFQLARH